MTISNKDKQIQYTGLYTILLIAWAVLHFWVAPQDWNTLNFANRLADGAPTLSAQVDNGATTTISVRMHYNQAPMEFDFIQNILMMFSSVYIGYPLLFAALISNYILWCTPEHKRYI